MIPKHLINDGMVHLNLVFGFAVIKSEPNDRSYLVMREKKVNEEGIINEKKNEKIINI